MCSSDLDVISENKLGIVNTTIADNNGVNIDAECKNCNGVGIVSNWMPINNLTEKPEPNVTNAGFCCNQERKAKQRVLSANTNVSKKYYQTTNMYLYNRCQTFKQRQFNFIPGIIDPNLVAAVAANPALTIQILEALKPGGPLASPLYVAQCNPNFKIEEGSLIAFINSISKTLPNEQFITQQQYNNLVNNTYKTIKDYTNSLQSILTKEQYDKVVAYLYKLLSNPDTADIITGPSNPKGCAKVYYKPNNPQFAQQGGVSSSTRLLKLNVDTINSAAKKSQKNAFIYKEKTPKCQAQTYIGNPFFFSGQYQNKVICRQQINNA